MLDLQKLAAKSNGTTTVVLDGITFTGDMTKDGLKPKTVDIDKGRITRLIREELERLGVKNMAMNISFTTEPADRYSDSPGDFSGAHVILTPIPVE